MMKTIFGNLFSFDEMISEQIIKIIYYIGLIAIVLGFIGSIYQSLTSGFGSVIPLLLMAIVSAALGTLLWRVFCECIIIVFRLYSRLGDINKTLGGSNKEAPIPGDDVLNEVREAALKAKAAATEKAKTLKSSIAKDDEAEAADLKPAAKKPAKKPAAKAATKKTATKPKTAAKKTTVKKTTAKSTAAKTRAAAKKTATKAKTAASKTSTAKKS